jgi:hypothetical protein
MLVRLSIKSKIRTFKQVSIKHELQNIITENAKVRNGEIIQSITDYLRGKKKTISEIEKAKFLKKQETQVLTEFIENNGFWYKGLDESKYIGEGAEQKIYEDSDPKFVLKLNDAIFYAFWEDYFNSLLIHNYFFPHLAYELLGFCLQQEKLYSVVKQPFVKSTESTNLKMSKSF